MLEQIEYSNLDFSSMKVHHKKRTRAVFKDKAYHYKLWDYGWEHGDVVRNCFEVGYYDSKICPAFVSMITHNGKDVGYIAKSGKVFGGSRDPWDSLVKSTNKKEQFRFLNEVLKRSIEHNRIISDMVPSNVILLNNVICPIDLEGVESYSWMFNGIPESHEAQNRNLNKVSKPYWGIMSKWTKMYAKQCFGLEFEKDLDCSENIQEIFDTLTRWAQNETNLL